MLDTAPAITLLTIMEIVGPLVLAGGLLYGMLVASRRPRASRRASDAAAHQMHRQKDE
jgi:hypothetical protein